MVRLFLLFLALLIICCTNKKPPVIKPTNQTNTKPRAVLKKHHIDTMVTKNIGIPTIKGTQTVACHLSGNNWQERIYWTILIVDRADTLLTFSDSSTFLDRDLHDTSLLNRRDSAIDEKKNWLLTKTTTLYLDTVKPSDRRRDLFKTASVTMFSRYFHALGYSEKQIADAHSFFWEYYKDKNIYMIGLPTSNPEESAYAFDPYTKKIIPFYHP